MKILLFGTTGLVGQGVLSACLADSRTAEIVGVARRACGRTNRRLREVIAPDPGVACDAWLALGPFHLAIYCIGPSAFGLSQADYERQTFDLALSIARPLAANDPGTAFAYVSGAGVGAESARHWARTKASVEAALAALPFRTVCSLRSALVIPTDGARPSGIWYRTAYRVAGPLARLVGRLLPDLVTDGPTIGRAALTMPEREDGRYVLENPDINRDGRMQTVNPPPAMSRAPASR